MESSQKKLKAIFNHSQVRVVCILLVLILISITISRYSTQRERVDIPAYTAFIEDYEFIGMVINQLNEAGFEFHAIHYETELHVTFFSESVQSQFASDIFLIDEISDRKIVLITGLTFRSTDQITDFTEKLGVPQLIRNAFENQHGMNVIKVLLNFGIVAWDSYMQKVNMDFIVNYHVGQIENLVNQLQLEVVN